MSSIDETLLDSIVNIIKSYNSNNIVNIITKKQENIIADLYTLSLLDYTHKECANIIQRFSEKYDKFINEEKKLDTNDYINKEHEYDPKGVFSSKDDINNYPKGIVFRNMENVLAFEIREEYENEDLS